MPGTADAVRLVSDAFEAFGVSADVPADVRWRFLVALDEALSNIVRYGYRDGSGIIHVTFTRDADLVSVAVVDTAPPFNPLHAPAPDPDAPLESRGSGGLGIALVRALMDDVQYERRDDHNCLVLTRKVSG